MTVTCNFHTHTDFCDGKNSAEEIVLAAIEKGMSALGFSGHAYAPCDVDCCMRPDKTEAYRTEILRLKEKYKDKIAIYAGLEMDYFSETDTSLFDYVIGSVHYVEKNGTFYAVDASKEAFQDAVNNGWGGDVYGFCEDYYKLVADVAEKTKADIIGHFDLVTKFNEGEALFCESHLRYVSAYRAALDALLPYGIPFEINTGAIQRGYRTKPYPAISILQDIKQQGGSILFSSDCHEKSGVDFGFFDAAALARQAGFTEYVSFSGTPMKKINILL